MDKKWKVRTADPEVVSLLKEHLHIHKVLCTLLAQRGVDSFDDAKHYFRPRLADLHSPWLMKDMDRAVNRVTEAFSRGEKILVYGDYDVDGTTAVACMYQFLKARRDDVDFYIPHRYREGYGISREGIDYAITQGHTLIISLDCGIKSIELIRYAREAGIDFIVCDHHLPDAELPPAVAILNPKQADCPYPYKELCGCGVGYKLISALSEAWDLPEDTPPLLPGPGGHRHRGRYRAHNGREQGPGLLWPQAGERGPFSGDQSPDPPQRPGQGPAHQ